MATIVNIAAYQFASLTDLKPLRENLLAKCNAWALRGTILLSTEDRLLPNSMNRHVG